MPKQFCVTGTCIPEKNYMVDISGRINRIIQDYIERGRYFTINRARQYGKTTTLFLLERKLKEKYLVLSLSFESVDEYFRSLSSLAEGLVMDIGECLRAQNVEADVVEEWCSPVSEKFPLRSLGMKISALCRNCGKKIVLMIDEVDKSSDNQIFLSFLGLLREKYLKWQQGKDVAFQSVILAGVYDVKTLKLKLHPQEEEKYNSPWNIAVDFNVDMSFSVSDIEAMLSEYEQDYRTGMEIRSVSRMLYDYTSGYPYLVSKICQLLDERGMENGQFAAKAQVWTKEGILAAVKLLLREPNTLFDDMTKKLLDYPKLKEMIQNILFRGTSFPFKRENPLIDLGVTFGFLKDNQGIVAVANRIFETQMYDLFLSEMAVNSELYVEAAASRKGVKNKNKEQIMKKKFEERIEVVKEAWENAAEGCRAESAVLDVLPGRQEVNRLREIYIAAMQEAEAAGAEVVNFPAVPGAPEPSAVFQACSVTYAALKSYMEEHERPERVRIYCADDEVFRLYMVVWNMYYAENKAKRMNDGRWD